MKDEGLREKVIKGIKCCFIYETRAASGLVCEECPYNKDNNLGTCTASLFKDALELLKENTQNTCESCVYCKLSDDYKWCYKHDVSPYWCTHLNIVQIDQNWFCADWKSNDAKRNATGPDEGNAGVGGLMPAT